MLNGNIRPAPSQPSGPFVAHTDNHRPFSWTSSTSTVSSISNYNKSEPVFRLNDDLSTPVFTSNSPLQLSWRNPRNEMAGDLTAPIAYRSSSSTMSDHETWDGDDTSTEGSRIYPIRSGELATTSFRSRDPCSVSSEELMETVFDNKPGPITLSGKAKTGSSDTSWLEDKLARDLSSIMPTFEFSNTNSFKRLSDRPMFSSSSESESSSDESQHISYSSSPEFEPRFPRHSWASNLEIIDSDTETWDRLKENSNSKRPKRDRSRSRRNSYDNSFRYRKPSSEKGTLKRNQQNQNEMQKTKLTYLRFESQTKCNHNERGIPVLKRLIKSNSNSSELIIEGDRVVVKFKRRKDYLCSSVKSRKRKVVLHLLDVVNCLVFTGSNTLVIQFRESTKTKEIKERSTLDKLSDTIRSSKSNSLSRSTRSTYSDGDSELSELEVGRFHNCRELAILILKQRQALIPKGILKRGGSLKTRPIEPIMIRPAKIGISPSPAEELMECLTYV